MGAFLYASQTPPSRFTQLMSSATKLGFTHLVSRDSFSCRILSFASASTQKFASCGKALSLVRACYLPIQLPFPYSECKDRTH